MEITRKEIESFGLTYIGKGVSDNYMMEGEFNMGSWTSYEIILAYHKPDNRFYITAIDRGSDERIFNGVCNNIAELTSAINMVIIRE